MAKHFSNQLAIVFSKGILKRNQFQLNFFTIVKFEVEEAFAVAVA
jgi:hypothetical protein